MSTLLVSTLLMLTLTSYRLGQRGAQTAGAGADAGNSMQQLYGVDRWPGEVSSAAAGPSQLLLLSYHHARAPLLSRLLMLMGVWAGEASQLRVDPHNRLRWWELSQVTALNDLMLAKHSSHGLPPSLARGFHLSSFSQQDAEYYADRVQGVLAYLNQHRPWQLQDPRLSWLAPRWLERLEQPMCVLVVHLQPQLLAEELASGRQVSVTAAGGARFDMADVPAAVHVERWTNATLSALKACFAVPTLVLPHSVLAPPLLQPFLVALQQHLQLAGVQGTRLPPDALLQQQYTSLLGSSSSSSADGTSIAPMGSCAQLGERNSSAADAASLLQQSCHWLPPRLSGQQAAGLGPGEQRLPLPTRALLDALADQMEATLASPRAGLDYSKVSGQLFTAYAQRVKQLLAAGHRAEHDAHGVMALVSEAMRSWVERCTTDEPGNLQPHAAAYSPPPWLNSSSSGAC